MKYLGFILVVVVALMAGQVLAETIIETDSQLVHSRAKRSQSDNLRSYIDRRLRMMLQEGNSTEGIPVMDRFTSEKMEIKFDHEFANVSAEAANVEVTGLSGYKIDTAKVAGFGSKIVVGLTWPYIYSTGSYKFEAAHRDKYRAYGSGDYVAAVTDLSVEAYLALRVLGTLEFTNVSTTISLGGLELTATGLFDDESTSNILSKVISDMTPKLIEKYQQELTTFINNNVKKMLNEFLKGKTRSDLLNILNE